MKEIQIYAYPYRSENKYKTYLKVDGNVIDHPRSRLTAFIVCQPIQKWLFPYRNKLLIWQGFLPELVRELNEDDFNIIFRGRLCDYKAFCNAIEAQRDSLARKGINTSIRLQHEECWEVSKMMESLQDIIKKMVREIVSRKHLEMLRNVEKEIHMIPVRFHSFTTIPGLAEKMKEIGCTDGENCICAILLDAHLPLREQSDIITSVVRDFTADDFRNTIIFLFSNDMDEAKQKCISVEASLARAFNNIFRCVPVYNTEDCTEAFKAFADEIYFPKVISAAMESIDRIIRSLDNWRENTYILRIRDSLAELAELPFYSNMASEGQHSIQKRGNINARI